MSGRTRDLTRLRHYVRRPVANSPHLWDASMLVRPSKRSTLARSDSALVIEGFPRSGNTFASAAFMVANGSARHLGRHLHGAAHLLRAARLGVPAIALVRDPRQAVLSYVIRRDHLTVTDALIEYSDFYRAAWPARSSFVVADFETVTRDFGSVIDAVNAKFGTDFVRFEGTDSQTAAAIDLVEQMNREECSGVVVESHVGRPSPERTARQAHLRHLLDTPKVERHLQKADDWFQRYLDRVQT